jgi:glycine/D-amino acid oxidase-like deaminating enzyme
MNIAPTPATRAALHHAIPRRLFVKDCAALSALSRIASSSVLQAIAADSSRTVAPQNQTPRVAVIGAGAFGGWTALYLRRRGARVTLLDAWGPGNSRASSGGETRVIRGTYGPNSVYTKMAARSLELWKENEARWRLKLYNRTGVLWMASGDDSYERAAMPLLREAGLAFEALTADEAAKRFAQINFDGVKWALLEKDAGYLTARRACEAVLDAFLAEGGEYRQLAVEPGRIDRGTLQGLSLSDGSKLSADHYVFACGPWLGKIFPGVMGNLIKPTRQEVFFFGTPAGDRRFVEDAMPAWIDFSARRFYGIPGNQWRGFKLACDLRGPEFDPTSGERTPSPESLQSARDYLDFRFPALKGASLLESRVCQYEQSPDENFIIDRHPQASNVWLVGGGSGHGFKHGPAIGELVGDLLLAGKPADPFFALARFVKA